VRELFSCRPTCASLQDTKKEIKKKGREEEEEEEEATLRTMKGGRKKLRFFSRYPLASPLLIFSPSTERRDKNVVV
jgi:hypothetical protein